MIHKFTISIIISLTIFICSCKNGNGQITPNKDNVFLTLDYDSVVAYSYNGESNRQIVEEGKLLSDRVKKQVKLDKTQTIKLTNLFCDKKSYGGDIAACFDPHFGIVFYKGQKPIAYVSVCLDCNYLVSSIKIPGERGFSSKGAKGIIDIEKELKFID